MRVLVTGGSRGIGRAICDIFCREGYEVFSPTRAELDLSDKASIEKYILNNRALGFEALINNAGINPIDYLEDIREEDFELSLQINLKAPLMLIKGFVGEMRKKGYGRIVNISSIWGIVSKERRLSYSVCKNGLNGITNTAALEYAKYNVLINSVCPGFVNTELTRRNLSREELESLKKQIPLGRLAEPLEIAETVYFLASSRNSYVTGQRIIIDGGYTSK